MSTTTRQPDLVTMTEAAKALGTTRGVPHYLRLSGALPAVMVGGRYLIPREAVEKLCRERAAQHGEKETPSR